VRLEEMGSDALGAAPPHRTEYDIRSHRERKKRGARSIKCIKVSSSPVSRSVSIFFPLKKKKKTKT